MKPEINKIYTGDSLEIMKEWPDEFVDTVITSPPYYALRNYEIAGQIGLEKTYQEYIEKLVNIFSEVKRVLKKSGSCFVNLGDSYASLGKIGGDIDEDKGMDINRGRSRIEKGSY